MQGIVSAIEWRRNHGLWSCSLVYFDARFKRLPLEPGSHLEFKVLDGRFCIGYTALSHRTGGGSSQPRKERAPCPHGAEIEQGIRCHSCQLADVVRPCLLCDGKGCHAVPQVRRACGEAVTYVYLASFGAGRIKAGVSRRGRVLKRWVEQGADMARRVLVGDGKEVRRFERRIHREFGAMPMVKAEEKLQLTGTDPNLEKAERILNRLEKMVHEAFPEERHIHEEARVLLQCYRLPQLDRRPLKLSVKGGRAVSGRVLAVKGPILLIEVKGMPTTLNLRRLIGRKIHSGPASTLKAQTGLERFVSKL